MPCSMLQILYKLAYDKIQSEEGQKEIQADAVQEVMEEGGLIP